jgi:hypothetical protein
MSDSKQISDKLDQILAKLDAIQKGPSDDVLKENFKKFMLANYNISWIDDQIESDIYDSIFSFVEELFLKK